MFIGMTNISYPIAHRSQNKVTSPSTKQVHPRRSSYFYWSRFLGYKFRLHILHWIKGKMWFCGLNIPNFASLRNPPVSNSHIWWYEQAGKNLQCIVVSGWDYLGNMLVSMWTRFVWKSECGRGKKAKRWSGLNDNPQWREMCCEIHSIDDWEEEASLVALT